MEFNASNILYFIAYISPVLVLGLVVFIGLLNSNAVGASLFVSMMSVIYFIGITMQKGLGVVSTQPKHPVCSVFGENLYMNPSLSSMLLFASITYIVLPFIMTNTTTKYIPLISVLIALWVLDFVIKMRHQCTNTLGVVMGTLVGGATGGLFTFLIYKFLNSGLLFHGISSSNNVVCNRPSERKFKCSVYKNGQLIKSL